MPEPSFELALTDILAPMCGAWKKAFANLPNLSITHGRFEEAEYDCMVSPANSFAMMDGGIDDVIRKVFPGVEPRAQKYIEEHFYGFQPVGTSFIIPTEDERHPWLAHTPTMRYPMQLKGSQVHNIYYAMWALLSALETHNRSEEQMIRRVCCPGFGTAVGRVPVEVSAKLMALAYRHFLGSSVPSKPSAKRREVELLEINPY